MTSSGKCVAVGTAVSGLGGALLVAYFIYTLESGTSFWTWPGMFAIALTSVGLLATALGVVLPDASTAQKQSGGRGSHNNQAGRDVIIHKGDASDG